MAAMDVLVDAAVEAKLVIIAVLQVLFRSRLGCALFRWAWSWVLEPCVLFTYYGCKIRQFILFFFHYVPSILKVTLKEVALLLWIEAVNVRYGSEAKDDVEVFFRLGIGRTFMLRAVKWGSGTSGDFCNHFFPQALAQAPAGIKVGGGGGSGTSTSHFHDVSINSQETQLVHVQIAESLLLMCILSYRSDAVIRDCLQHGMFSGVSYYAVHTDRTNDTDICLFVHTQQKWAVVCFRGRTVFQSLWDYVSASILFDETIPFASCSRHPTRDNGSARRSLDNNHSNYYCPRVHKRPYQSMRRACGEGRMRRCYEVEPPFALPSPRLNATVFELVHELHHNNQFKIYVTGHSLGGGLACLFGAHIVQYYKVTPAAVVSFGSPPVAGNDDFVEWFQNRIPHAWRFVYGHEFPPLCPPFPFFVTPPPKNNHYNYFVCLQHVGSLVDVQNLRSTTTSTLKQTSTSHRTLHPHHHNNDHQHKQYACNYYYDEIERHSDQLAQNRNLGLLLYDHNPILTLRVLHLEMARAEHFVTSSSSSSSSWPLPPSKRTLVVTTTALSTASADDDEEDD